MVKSDTRNNYRISIIRKTVEIRFKKGGYAMIDWMDFNGDGELDGAERMFAEEMLCGSREEHIALFGDAGDFKDSSEDSDFDCDMEIAGLDADERA